MKLGKTTRKTRSSSTVFAAAATILLSITGFEASAQTNLWWTGKSTPTDTWANTFTGNGNQRWRSAASDGPADSFWVNGNIANFTATGDVFTITVTTVTPYSMAVVSSGTNQNYTFNGGTITAAGVNGTFTQSGAGTTTFGSGNTAVFGGKATVNSGTLQINSSFTSNGLDLSSGAAVNVGTTGTSGTLNTGSGNVAISGTLTVVNGSLQSTGTIQVNNGGSLVLAGSTTNTRVSDGAAISLNGGNINLNGGSEELGVLTLSTSGSSLTIGGTTGASTLNFQQLAGSGTINVFNWNTGDKLTFDTAPVSGSNVVFKFYSGTTTSSGFLGSGTYQPNGEINPVPEPSTIIAGVALVAFLGWRERRRISSVVKRNQDEETLVTA